MRIETERFYRGERVTAWHIVSKHGQDYIIYRLTDKEYGVNDWDKAGLREWHEGLTYKSSGATRENTESRHDGKRYLPNHYL